MALLGRDRALEFVERVGVEGGEELLSRDPAAFVNGLLGGFMEHVPFQSVSMMAVPEEERRVPSLEEVVAAGLSLEGGVCFTLNTFMCVLLRALGLQARVLEGSHKFSPGAHTHVLVLLQDLRFPGDDHIIDVGSGYPFLEAVAVANLPSEHHQVGLHCRYERKGDLGLICHRGFDHQLGTEDDATWDKIFDFNFHPVDYSFFYSYMDRVYVRKEGVFLNSLRAVRFPPSAGDGRRIMVAFKDQSLLLGRSTPSKRPKWAGQNGRPESSTFSPRFLRPKWTWPSVGR